MDHHPHPPPSLYTSSPLTTFLIRGPSQSRSNLMQAAQDDANDSVGLVVVACVQRVSVSQHHAMQRRDGVSPWQKGKENGTISFRLLPHTDYPTSYKDTNTYVIDNLVAYVDNQLTSRYDPKLYLLLSTISCVVHEERRSWQQKGLAL